LLINSNKDIEIIKTITNKYPLQLLAVGGFVRDSLLKKEAKDIDFLVITTNKSIFESFVNEVQKKFYLHKVNPSNFDNIVKLISSTKCFDFSLVNKESLKNNLLNRDFTINSLAWNFTTNELIDFAQGQNDLNKKIIRQINENCFSTDPVRILRMYRFQTQLNFSIHKETEKNAKKYANKITEPAGERIKDELEKILTNDLGYNAVENIFSHLIFHLFPDFKQLQGIQQNGYHHLNVLDHILLVVKHSFQIDKLIDYYQNFNITLTNEDKLALRLAAIFHDLGKGNTFKLNTKGITTFHNHQYLSADLFKESVKQLHYSNSFTERVYFLIRRHMLFLNFMINGYTEKSFRKFINLMREDTLILLLLVTADKLSAKGPLSKGNMEKLIKVGNAFLKTYNKDKEDILSLPKLVSGEEVMEIMNISPSKQVGHILNKISEKQLESRNFSRENALTLLHSLKSKGQI